MDQTVLKYGLRPTVRLADNVTPFAALFDLKKDDSEGAAKAVCQLIGTKEFGDAVSEMALIHIFSLTRIGTSQMLFQTNFDTDVVSYFEAFKDLETPVRAVLTHFEGAPGSDAEFTAVLEFFASRQVEVAAYYCAYPTLTVNQIRRDADWREKMIDLQKSLVQPAGKSVWGQVASSL
ncbi:MAG: hypothetical protein AAF844_00265 [Pseudomonadota bacterium]